MDINDCKPNSYKSRSSDKEKKVEKIVKGTVKTKKKSEIRKFTDVFISEDISNVKSYIFNDVLVPAVKNAIVDIVTDGINMIFGTSKGKSKNTYSTNYRGSYVSYSARRDEPRSRGRDSRDVYSYDDIILDNRVDCEEVLTKMDEIIDMYGVASVADLFDLVGVTGNYTDNKFGWTNLRNADVTRVRDGYKIKMPKALPI